VTSVVEPDPLFGVAMTTITHCLIPMIDANHERLLKIEDDLLLLQYGLKQGARNWYETVRRALGELGFQ
jgi:hypothetical protein